MHDKKEKWKKRQRMMLIILTIALLIAGVSAIFIPLLMQEIELNHDAEEYADLIEQYGLRRDVDDNEDQVSKSAVSPDKDIEATMALVPQTATVPASTFKGEKTGTGFADLQAANEDFVAWIQIPGTKINYPVVLTDNVDYYLTHTFTGKESKLGTLFSLGKTDYRSPSKNIAVYGHHIRGSGRNMFQPLISYKKKQFYSGHQTIYFDTLYHTGTYKIFAVINMHKGDWDPSTTDFVGGKNFLDFLNRAKSQSLYDTSVEVKASDQILTLITCDRSHIPIDGRLVIMAVKQ